MSLTDKNFNEEFERRNQSNAEYNQRLAENDRPTFWRAQDFVDSVNNQNKMRLSIIKEFTHHITIKGRAQGWILTDENKRLQSIKVLAEVYGYVVKDLFYTEEDEGTTFIQFEIRKPINPKL